MLRLPVFLWVLKLMIFLKKKGRGITRCCQWSELFDGKIMMSIFSSSLISQSTWGYFCMLQVDCKSVTFSLVPRLFGSCTTAHPNWTDRKDNSLLCGDFLTWSDLTIGGIHRASAEAGVAVMTWPPASCENKRQSAQAKTGSGEIETLICHVSIKPKSLY